MLKCQNHFLAATPPHMVLISFSQSRSFVVSSTAIKIHSNHDDARHGKIWLVAWHSGRMLVFDQRTFLVLRRVTTYVGKPSAVPVGQPILVDILAVPCAGDFLV